MKKLDKYFSILPIEKWQEFINDTDNSLLLFPCFGADNKEFPFLSAFPPAQPIPGRRTACFLIRPVKYAQQVERVSTIYHLEHLIETQGASIYIVALLPTPT